MVKSCISNLKFRIAFALLVALFLTPDTWYLTPAFPQQPQAQQGQPLYAVNAKYVNGVAPGYWPTAGSGLTLNLSAGTVLCGAPPLATSYAGGTLTMTASATNYVFLNPATGCSPYATTSAFANGQIPIAIVVTGTSTITSVVDVRTWFSTPGVGGVVGSGGIIYASQYLTGTSDCGLQEAYNAAPSTGAYIIFNASGCTISSAQTVTLTVGKPLYIEGAGAVISMSHISGVGLHFVAPSNQPSWSISNLTFTYTGTASGIYGVELDGMCFGTTLHVNFFNFGAGNNSWPLWVHGAEQNTFIDTNIESGMSGYGYVGGGLYIDGGATANHWYDTKINNVETAIALYGGENFFDGGTIQGANATYPIVVDTTAGTMNFHMKDFHFEGNGDQTNNTALFFFNLTGGGNNFNLLDISNSVMNQAQGYIYKFAGTGTVLEGKLEINQYLVAAASGICTGVACTSPSIISVNNLVQSGTDVGGQVIGTRSSGGCNGGRGPGCAGLFSPQLSSTAGGTTASTGLVNDVNNDKIVCAASGTGGSDVCYSVDASDVTHIGGPAGIAAALYSTSSVCLQNQSPAACGGSPTGSVVIPAAATSVVVNTSAVTAHSQILLTEDSSLGTLLGATCNTQSLLTLGVPKVTARTPGASFTIGLEVAPTSNPLCISYSIVN